MLILVISSGPDQGQVHELHDSQPVILGREGDPVRLEDRKASRHHARIWAELGQWFIQDLDSRHGTYHNGQSIGGAPVKLAEGDRIRIGDTRLVLARVPMELAERAQLLGDPASEREALRAVAPGRGVARVGALAVAAALAGVIGLNIYALVRSQADTRQLRQQIAAVQSPPRDESLEPMLRDILAAVEARPDRAAALADLRAVLADLPDARAALQAVLARIEAQSQDQAADAVASRATLETILAQVEAQSEDIASASASRDTLAQVLARLETDDADARTHARLDAVLARLDARPPYDDAAVRQGLERVLTRLDEQPPTPAPTIDAEALADTVARRVTASADAVAQRVADAADAMADRLIAAADADRRVLQRVASQLTVQRELAGQVAQLRELVAGQAGTTRQVLEAALSEVAGKGDVGRLLEAVAQVRQAMPPDATARFDALLARLDDQATADQLAEAVRGELDRQAQSQEATIGELRRQLERLAQAQRTTPQTILTELRAATAARADADARLAELVELAAAAPPPGDDRIEPLLRQVLADLHALSQRSDENQVLVGVLRELRGKTIANMDELRQALRTELDARLLQSPAPAATAAPALAAAASSAESSSSTRVSMTSALLGEQADASDLAAEPLSRTEQAYQRAFETGRPVTLGAGALNPLTGTPAPGRTLDPAAAKAAGIKSWREWYLMDDFAERMRLQQQALRYRQDNPTDPDLVTLPRTPTR